MVRQGTGTIHLPMKMTNTCVTKACLLCYLLLFQRLCESDAFFAFPPQPKNAGVVMSCRQHPLLWRSSSLQQAKRTDDADENDAKSSGSIQSNNRKGIPGSEPGRGDREVGGYDPSERIGGGIDVGDPQIKVKEKERSVTSILKELAAIQQQGPQKYCILGTRHCSFLHQQIIELLYVS